MLVYGIGEHGQSHRVPVVPCRESGRVMPQVPPEILSKASKEVFGVVKLTLRDKETAQGALRRFRKLVERSGIKKEIRIREFYEKPSETKRRARLRAQRRARRERMIAGL